MHATSFTLAMIPKRFLMRIFLIVSIYFWQVELYSQQLSSPEKKRINVCCGELLIIDTFPSKLIPQRTVAVWLPSGYSSNTKYPVFYFHDGQMLFDSLSTWNKQEWGVDEVFSSINQVSGSPYFPQAIVVGIWNNGRDRHSNYFPQQPMVGLDSLQKTRFMSLKRGENLLFSTDIYSDNYVDFIVRELKPYIDGHFSTLPDKSNTSIAGSSMGGLISMYAAVKYPNIFGNVVCLSTHWIGAFDAKEMAIFPYFEQYLKDNLLVSDGSQKWIFTRGGRGLDAFYEQPQNSVNNIFISKGYIENKTFFYKLYPEHTHNERAWNYQLQFVLKSIWEEN